jgi:hypothetical protein
VICCMPATRGYGSYTVLPCAGTGRTGNGVVEETIERFGLEKCIGVAGSVLALASEVEGHETGRRSSHKLDSGHIRFVPGPVSVSAHSDSNAGRS